MDIKTKIENDIDEIQTDLEILDIELNVAYWDEREEKLKLKKHLLNSRKKLYDRLDKLEN